MNITIVPQFCSEGVEGRLMANSLSVDMHYTEQHRMDWTTKERLENYARLRYAQEILACEEKRLKQLLLEDMPEQELAAAVGQKFLSNYGTISMSRAKGSDMQIVSKESLVAVITPATFIEAATISKTNLVRAVGEKTYKDLVTGGILVDSTTVKTVRYTKPQTIERLAPASGE